VYWSVISWLNLSGFNADDGGQPNVDAALVSPKAVTEPRKSTIGVRKPAPKKGVSVHWCYWGASYQSCKNCQWRGGAHCLPSYSLRARVSLLFGSITIPMGLMTSFFPEGMAGSHYIHIYSTDWSIMQSVVRGTSLERLQRFPVVACMVCCLYGVLPVWCVACMVCCLYGVLPVWCVACMVCCQVTGLTKLVKIEWEFCDNFFLAPSVDNPCPVCR